MDRLTEQLETHGVRIDYGKHDGELFTRLPISYLKWMVNQRPPKWEFAKAELDRRGTSTPTLEVSGHALDRFSLRHLDVWRDYRNDDEGIWSFLHRQAAIAITMACGEDGTTKVTYLGCKWVFSEVGEWPVLKTVM